MSGKKITGRTKQLSLKSTPEFHQRLKELAVKEKCLMIEVLEQAMELYENQRTKKKAVKENVQPIIRETITLTKSSKRSRDDDEQEEQNTNPKKRKING